MCFQCLSRKALSFLVPRTLPSVSWGKALRVAPAPAPRGTPWRWGRGGLSWLRRREHNGLEQGELRIRRGPKGVLYQLDLQFLFQKRALGLVIYFLKDRKNNSQKALVFSVQWYVCELCHL